MLKKKNQYQNNMILKQLEHGFKWFGIAFSIQRISICTVDNIELVITKYSLLSYTFCIKYGLTKQNYFYPEFHPKVVGHATGLK